MDNSIFETYEEIKYNVNNEICICEGISFKPKMSRGTESSGGIIYKDGKKVAETDVMPSGSFEDGGFFLVLTKDKKSYKYCNENGQFTKREFGKKSSPFYNGFARVEIIDEYRAAQYMRGKQRPSYFTFAKKGKNGKFMLMKQRFAYATFIDRCGLGRVVVAGENRFAYVTKKGTVLPYRFLHAEDCFRNGMAEVTLLDGRDAFIRANYDIVEFDEQNRIKVITTLKQFVDLQNNIKEYEESMQSEEILPNANEISTQELQPEQEIQQETKDLQEQSQKLKEEILDYYSDILM
ncbi:MAG: hypothetical protein E7379_00030 [Clostridiales bacterium]|nr:hypothetical protein [Clostridiales bacterium]